MENEYLVYAEDMKMIADAIRLKSGSSEQLLFPDGFVTEIENLSGGSGVPEFDTTSTYTVIDDGDDNWRIKFLTSGTFTPKKSCTIDVFLVGGGASGASGGKDEGLGSSGGGGGGGYTKTIPNVYIEANREYEIVIGAGGAAVSGKTNTTGNKGGTTSAFGYSITGGNPPSNYTYGGNGGSGGGAGYYGNNAGGTDGGNGKTSSRTPGQGQGTTTREFGESTGTLYSTGGGNGTNVSSVSVAYGEPNTGDGGNGSTSNYSYAGGSGIVVIRNARG